MRLGAGASGHGWHVQRALFVNSGGGGDGREELQKFLDHFDWVSSLAGALRSAFIFNLPASHPARVHHV